MKKLTFLVIAAFFVSCVDLSNPPTHDYYTLRVNANPEAGGTATPNPKKDVYVGGENVTVTAAPSAGYTFTGWAGAVTGTANQVTVTMNGDKQLTAIFQKIEAAAPAYTLTADASPPGGGTVSLAPDKTSYAAGEKVKVTADTADGYAFTGWSGASEATTDTVTITMDGDKSLQANFEWRGASQPNPPAAAYTLTVGANPAGGGVVSRNPSKSAYKAGEQVIVTATENSGYKFTNWSGASTATTNSVIIIMNDNQALLANFQPIETTPADTSKGQQPAPTTHTLAVGKDPATGGSVAVSPEKTAYASGELVSVTARAAAGYLFAGWSGASTSEDTTVTLVMNGDKSLTAKFVKTYAVTFNANGGDVTPTSGATGAKGKLAELPNPEKDGHTFDGWYMAETGGEPVTTNTVFNANATIYARWVAGVVPTYTVTFNAKGGTGAPENGTTDASGKLVSLPTPQKAGHTFEGWHTAETGGEAVSENFVFRSDATIYARWALVTITLNVFADASLTEALNDIAEQYKNSAPAVTLSFNLDSSGKLRTQIEDGAEADVFFSAGQKQMDALAEYIITDTRKDLLRTELVLIAPTNNKAGVSSFQDCLTDKVKLIAIGGAGTAVGQYTEELFSNMSGWDKVQKKASLGTNVGEILSQVQNGTVDCGVVYAVDAAGVTGITVLATAPEGSHKPAIFPAAVLNGSANADAARAFLDYLSSPAAAAVFEGLGFTTVGE